MNEQEYIECEVFRHSGMYRFNMSLENVKALGLGSLSNTMPIYFSLSEAVNIPGFCGVEYYFGDTKCDNGLEHYGAPKKVRFRVPVADKEESVISRITKEADAKLKEKQQPPKCEDCKWCVIISPDELDRGCKFDAGYNNNTRRWQLGDCEYERERGKCGPDGKCFVAKEREVNSGDAAKVKA